MLGVPETREGETATEYADRIGQWYAAQVSPEHKKEFGQYLTPVAVARYMGSLFENNNNTIKVLDAGAGCGVLSCAVCETFAASSPKPKGIALTVYETDLEILPYLRETLRYLQKRLELAEVKLDFQIKSDDFVLSHAACLNDSPRLFKADREEGFDLVISNPPYFKIPKSDPRAQAAAAVVYGQPNIYGLFMAISANLLSASGQLIFITPRSFASGPYFKRFREKFFEKVTPKLIHIFGSRRDAFNRDEILQENIIMKCTRSGGGAQEASNTSIIISSSNGAGDLGNPTLRTVPLDFALDINSTDKVLRIPVSSEDDEIIRLFHSWSGSLRKYGLEISTGPVVPFRALTLLHEEGRIGEHFVPLLWMQHVKHLTVEWPIKVRKPQYIEVSGDSMPLLVADKNYVLLRRFSAKEEQRRLTAGAYIAGEFGGKHVGLENHLNYIHRPKGTLTEQETWGLTALLSSSLFDKYFRAVNGNTQVSATELRAMPLPPLDLIVRLGQRVMQCNDLFSEIDSIVMDELFQEIAALDRLVPAYG
ncbi:MAG: Eco57I restriction-modification methylase domain-containing protein [Candidatus Obscuribacterales bacterium]|nr:Eco57I restriction-modification methylase domain-containing protein [Candidatus Obscuribacterales bacterium]